MPKTSLATGAVTSLFTDIEGSPRLWQLDPASIREDLVNHDEIGRTAMEANEGSASRPGVSWIRE